MRFREYAPDPRLAGYVQLISIAESKEPSEAPPERIVADGIVELVFHYGCPFATSFAGRAWDRQPRSFLITQVNHPIQIRPTGQVGFLSIRFYPWGAYHFVKAQLRDFADVAVPAELVWKDRVAPVTERLALATSSRQRLQIAQEFLIALLTSDARSDATLDAIVRQIYEVRGVQRISALSEATGVSERTLERRMANTVGMSPKQVSRLARFLGACRALRENPERPLADVALELTYYDQAHLAGDFKRFAGVTPRDFRSNHGISYLDLAADVADCSKK